MVDYNIGVNRIIERDLTFHTRRGLTKFVTKTMELIALGVFMFLTYLIILLLPCTSRFLVKTVSTP